MFFYCCCRNTNKGKRDSPAKSEDWIPGISLAPGDFHASTLLLQLPRESSLCVITNDRSCEKGVMIKLKVFVFLPPFMGMLRLLVITCPDFYREDTTAANRDSYVLLLLLQKHQQGQKWTKNEGYMFIASLLNFGV